jgi:hypothetical protein
MDASKIITTQIGGHGVVEISTSFSLEDQEIFHTWPTCLVFSLAISGT